MKIKSSFLLLPIMFMAVSCNDFGDMIENARSKYGISLRYETNEYDKCAIKQAKILYSNFMDLSKDKRKEVGNKLAMFNVIQINDARVTGKRTGTEKVLDLHHRRYSDSYHVSDKVLNENIQTTGTEPGPTQIILDGNNVTIKTFSYIENVLKLNFQIMTSPTNDAANAAYYEATEITDDLINNYVTDLTRKRNYSETCGDMINLQEALNTLNL